MDEVKKFISENKSFAEGLESDRAKREAQKNQNDSATDSVGILIRTEAEKVAKEQGYDDWDKINPDKKLEYITLAIINLEKSGVLIAGNLPIEE